VFEVRVLVNPSDGGRCAVIQSGVAYLDVGGVPTYHEVHGAGEPVVLLHGGFCSIETVRPQIAGLEKQFTVYAPERRGHGRSPDDGQPFDYGRMVAETLCYLDSVGLSTVDVVGFSDGAIIGILLARDHPARVRSLVAISANLDTSGFVSDDEAEAAFSDTDVAALLADYDRLSPDGSGQRPSVWERMVRMWDDQPDISPESLSAVSCPTLIMAADRDVIALDHTLRIRDAIAGARLCVVPGATHMLLAQRPEIVNAALLGLLTERS
jgi:pimeloyl-ACP methyl ester carboxylesterase